jgi:hypothetical protein
MKTNLSTLQQPIINISKFEVEEFITRKRWVERKGFS